MVLNRVDREHLLETLKACKEEFEELVYTKDWYVTSVLDQIESSLEILTHDEAD